MSASGLSRKSGRGDGCARTPPTNDLLRFIGKTKRNGECLEWVGARRGGKTGKIYGAFWWRGFVVYAHRYAWMRYHGPICALMVVDHLCENPLCVRLEHLDLVSREENLRRRFER